MATVQTIPQALIYEMDGDRPIYYAGYRAVLEGNAKIEDVVGTSGLQSFLLSDITAHLIQHLDRRYRVGSSEIGLQLAQGYRAADVAVFERSDLRQLVTLEKYVPIPPKVVIEVDIKADMSELDDATGYFHRKTDQLLEHGVAQVIWIFTSSQKVMIAQPGEAWSIQSWHRPVDVLDVTLTIGQIAADMLL